MKRILPYILGCFLVSISTGVVNATLQVEGHCTLNNEVVRTLPVEYQVVCLTDHLLPSHLRKKYLDELSVEMQVQLLKKFPNHLKDEYVNGLSSEKKAELLDQLKKQEGSCIIS